MLRWEVRVVGQLIPLVGRSFWILFCVKAACVVDRQFGGSFWFRGSVAV